jgi:DNA-directed RNA polymerase specialized sigma24 family protein
MMAGNDCDCLICRLEASLLEELNEKKGLQEYRRWAASSDVLAAFPTASELIAHLHRQQCDERSSSPDEILVELVGAAASGVPHWLLERLLLLVFVPTMHRTTRQVSAAFPLLAREDTAQHLFAILLEFLHSKELRSRRSHLAYAVARKMRRSAFRWAIRESRLDSPNDSDGSLVALGELEESVERADPHVLLAQFLDNCQRQGWLSEEERQLLTEFKLDRVSGAEIARRSGHTAVAIHHRIQRLLERLRRIARKSGSDTPEQLDLFRC